MPLGRTTAKGHRLTLFPVATARRRAAEASEGAEAGGAVAAAPKESTDWHQIVAWGQLARVCEDNLHVGQQVYVEGTVHHHSYSIEVNGEKSWRKISEVYTDQVRFLGGARRERGDVAEVLPVMEEGVGEAVSFPAPADPRAEVA